MSRSPTQLERRLARRGWRWSFSLHVGIVIALLAKAIWIPWPTMQTTGVQEIIATSERAVNDLELTVEMPLDERTWMMREAESLSFTPVDLHDPAWEAILAEPMQATPETTTRNHEEGRFLLAQEIQRGISATSEKTGQENLEELARLSNKLNRVSTEQGVEEVNGTIGRLLGTGERATTPVENTPSGPFDYTSAQVHDVRQETSADGTLRYVAIMLDAAGRTQNVEMDAAHGEQLWRTMQIVKSNPLLERVYRGVVMGLIDQALKER